MNDLGALEGRSPDRIVKRRRRDIEADDAGLDDGARAINAGEEGRGDMRAGRRYAAARRLENRVTLGMLHPDETTVAGMAFLEVSHPRRERVARGDFRTVLGRQHGPDFADPVWACCGGAQGRLHHRARRDSLFLAHQRLLTSLFIPSADCDAPKVDAAIMPP